MTAFSVGALVLFAPVTDRINPVEASNVSVHLNDEITMPDIENGTVATRVASGTPGDHLTVRADILVETPMEEGDGSPYDVEMSFGTDSKTTNPFSNQVGNE